VDATHPLRPGDLRKRTFVPIDGNQLAMFCARLAPYSNHAKMALLDNFVTVLLKVLIKASEPDLLGHEDAVLRWLVAFATLYDSEGFKSGTCLTRLQLPLLCGCRRVQ
jgi:hypothetical protein